MIRSTKVVALSLAFLGLGVLSPAQDEAQQRLIKLRDEKLAEPWLKTAPWITDYDLARAETRCRLCLEYDDHIPECLNGMGLINQYQKNYVEVCDWYKIAIRYN